MKIEFYNNEECTIEINSKGFVKLDRKILDWEWYKNQNTKAVFIHCLLKANYKEKKYQGITIPRGSFLSSENTLAKELNLSRQNIRTAIKHLILTKELTKKLTKVQGTECTLFIVQKYDLYQSTNQALNQETNFSLTTTKKEKKKKENNNGRRKQQPEPSLQVIEVVEYLNEKLGKKENSKFKATTPDTMKKISARLKQGYTLEELKKVVDVKCDEWLGTDYAKYLRPKTLFSESNFESYLMSCDQTNKKVKVDETLFNLKMGE